MGKVTLSISMLVLAGLILLGASFLEFAQVKAVLDARAPDGDADQFTQSLHASVVILLRIYAAACLGLASLILINRHRLAGISLSTVWASLTKPIVDFCRETTRLEALCFATIIALGTCLRLMVLDQPIRSDEAWTYLNYVSRDILHVLTEYSSPNNHILHNVLAHLSIQVFGDKTVILRLPSLVAGVLALPVGFWFFFRLSGRPQAFVAMALLACWPMLVDYSTNARGYSMVVLLTLAIFAAANEIRLTGRVIAFVAFGVFAALGLYTVPSCSLSILAAGFWLLLLTLVGEVLIPPIRFWSGLSATAVGSVLLTALLYAPVIAANGFGALASNDVTTGVGMGFSQIAATCRAVAEDWIQGVPIWILLVLAAGLAVMPWARDRVQFMIGIGLLAALTTVVTLQGTMGPERIWIFALPLFLGAAGWGMARLLPRSWRTYGCMSVSLALPLTFIALQLGNGSLGRYNEFGEFPEARDVTKYLTNEMSAGDLLLTMFPANRTITYYDLRHNGKATITKYRSGGQGDPEARTFVVVPAEATLEDALHWNDTAYGTAFTQRAHNVTTRSEFGNATVFVLDFDET